MYIRARVQIRLRALRCTRQFSLRRSASEFKVDCLIIVVVVIVTYALFRAPEIDSTCRNAYAGRSHITFGSEGLAPVQARDSKLRRKTASSGRSGSLVKPVDGHLPPASMIRSPGAMVAHDPSPASGRYSNHEAAHSLDADVLPFERTGQA